MKPLIAAFFALGAGALSAQPSAPVPGTIPGSPVRRAKTGHVTNYDEAKVGAYTLPDPLVLADGRRVTTPLAWFGERKPQILELYRRDIYGRVPANAPEPTFTVEPSDPNALGGAAQRKVLRVRFGSGPDAPVVRVIVYLPRRRPRPVPLLLQLTFRGEEAAESPPPSATVPAAFDGPYPPELPPIAEVISRGYGYAYYRYTDLQPDSRDTRAHGVEALCAKPGSPRAPDAWGTISVWAWGASRVLDCLLGDPEIDGRHVALIGHSRLGKTVLWAGAQDPRFALVFSSCAGEMGSSLSRRDYGETIDDMAQHFPWQFAPNFQRYAGHWKDLPVDAHFLIALNAPHPVMITGGTLDRWADPRGEFLAEVAASPVYRLLGERGIGTTRMPAPDHGVFSGALAFRYHDGPHAILPADWQAFLAYADRYLHPSPR